MSAATSRPATARKIRRSGDTSEIQVGVVCWRRDARKLVGQERAEARARLHARVPVLGAGMLLPRHVADVVERRELGGGADVGERELVARQPAPAVDQPA